MRASYIRSRFCLDCHLRVLERFCHLSFPYSRDEGLDFTAPRYEPGHLRLCGNYDADRHRQENAIMMIDFALEAQRKEGKSPAEAIYQGCLVRFRPIMMTTMAALMGTLPIALGFGAGGEARRPLGVSVVGGLAFSQLVTLFLTPVFYIYMEDAKRWGTQVFGRKRGADSETGSSSPGPVSSGPIGTPIVRSKNAPDL